MTSSVLSQTVPLKLDAAKFRHPERTADGEQRASVKLKALEVLWFNTGTLCNIECKNCYIESSPTNDRLVYLSLQEVTQFLDEIRQEDYPVRQIGFTGGESFLNPEMPEMMEAALEKGFEVLILTNAMRPMMRPAVQAKLSRLLTKYREQIIMRVSLDHYAAAQHDTERGKGSFAASLKGLLWLAEQGAIIHVAARMLSGESEDAMRQGFAGFFAEHNLAIDAADKIACMIFPEMDASIDVPEITTKCWDILQVDPNAMMCATSRMIVKRKGAAAPVVLPCTLLPYGEEFEMGASLKKAKPSIALNHPHCARFCVLGGASCAG